MIKRVFVVLIFLIPIATASSAFGSSYPVDRLGGMREYATALTIGGSDPSGGAGIQADLKTFTSLQVYGMSALTVLSVQNTQGVQGLYSLPVGFLTRQLDSIFSDIKVGAIKTGALERAEIINETADYLAKIRDENPDLGIVVDPVIVAKSGDQIIQDEAIMVLKERILPLATIITPNKYEVQRLLGSPTRMDNKVEIENAARELLVSGAQAVIIKGGVLSKESKDLVSDCFLMRGGKPYWFTRKLVKTDNLHGTGCTFSAAIAAYLAKGYGLFDAVERAEEYIGDVIANGAEYKIGKGKGPVNHFYRTAQYGFTQTAWIGSQSIYEKIKKHPFISELASGALSNEKFSYYILQDHFFLKARAEAFRILSKKAPNQNLAGYLSEMAERSYTEAENIFDKYKVDRATIIKESQQSAACIAYAEYMKDKANSSFNEGLVALLPCSLIYQKIGEHIKPKVKADNKYILWIDTYSDSQRRSRVIKFIDVIDQAVAATSLEEQQRLKMVFQQASQFEFDFWQDVCKAEFRSEDL